MCVNLQPNFNLHAFRMRKFFRVFCWLAIVFVFLASCKKKDDATVTLYNDAAITGFTLGTLTQYTPGTSNVVATLTGSNYIMVIDQVESKVYNRDSLPIGTSVSGITCTVTSLNNGAIYVKNTTDDQFLLHSSSTAIDFSQPRIFRIVSSDGSYTRDYTVSLNVKKTAYKTFAWKQKAEVDALKNFTKLRLIAVGVKLYAFGVKDGAVVINKSDDEGVTWNTLTTDLTTPLTTTVCENIVVKDGKILVLNNGKLLSTTDGEHWQEVSVVGTPGLKQLFGTSTKEIFALSDDGGIKASTDGGVNWTTEKIAASALLPSAGIACTRFVYAPADSTDYVLMAGNNGTRSVVWRKISKYGGINKGGQWVCLAYETTNKNPLPLLTRLSMVCHSGNVLAFGPGTTAYQTVDQGITWSANATYKLPTEAYCVATDSRVRLWAIGTNGKVYLGTYY